MFTKGSLIALAFAILVGCGEKQPKKTYKYTIWVGSAIVAYARHTDNYERTEDTVIFYKTNGRRVEVPLCNIMSIEENKAEGKQ